MSEEKKEKFSCIIVGGGTLPIRCAEILLRNHHEICAIASSDTEVKKWAIENKISHLLPGSKLAEQINQPFDYLFSIVNEHILREDVLRLPRKLAINYHDAPLPRYAGTHATSWALMNGETTHGITWHLITDVIDAGDILRQDLVEVSKNDTALTLNTKCYEAAIRAFKGLVDDLSSGTAVAEKQNLEKRTFFPRFKRPANAGVISWNKPAAEISALVRALNFGNHPNPLGAAKMMVGNEFFIVPNLEILDAKAESASGTINKIGQFFLQISAADNEIVLRKVLNLNGKVISIADLTAKFYLREGFQFADLDAKSAQKIEQNNKSFCKHENYWVKKFSALEPAVPPFSNRTTVSDSAEYKSLPIQIPVEFLAFSKQSPNEQKLSDSVFASFGAYLARLGGIDNFDVGFSDAEFQIAGLENLFATQIPFRFNVDCLQNFDDYFKSFEKEIESIKKHETFAQDIFARFPQLCFTSESSVNFTLPVAFAKITRFEDFEPSVGNKLMLVISDDEAACRWIYDENRIDAENIEKLINHFTNFLKSIAENSQNSITDLSLLTEAEQNLILFEWNETRADFPGDICVSQLFIECVEKFPDSIAVACGNIQLSYADLNDRSNQLARRLQTMNVGMEDIVAVFMERSIEMVVGLLGILKTGAAYLPLDPAYPKDRLSFMLKDAAVRVILTKQQLAKSLPETQCAVLCLDNDWDEIKNESSENLEILSNGKNLVYVIYTSGSTGNPKGVEIEHSGLVNLITWHQRFYQVSKDDRATLLAGPAFDASVWELWSYLTAGAGIYIPDEETRSTPAKLLLWLADNKITISFLPTPLAEAVLELPMPKNLTLRALLTGGDRLHPVNRKSLPFKLINHYGPTENTVVTTCDIVETDNENKVPPTIGHPIQNVQVYLLDRFLKPVPIGISGEIYIGGNGLARGYLNRPDLTNERFINHSLGEKIVRLYRTGDHAQYLSNGKINFIDRIDNQVKIRGFRIELGEIESKLLAHSEIREAVVITREDQSGDKRLVAYFVPKQSQSLKFKNLRDYLKQKLPDYMIPSAFVELDEMPLTPNGKINRKALPVPASTHSESDRVFVAHRDDLESKLVKIWETILGVQPIGVQDNFFELGGHSLNAVRMFAEVEETFSKNIPLATLFEAGTIEKLAEILRQDGWAEPESSLVPIQSKGTKPIFFCIHAKGGNVLFYRDLAKHLGEDQPFYGIQARRLAGRQVGHGTVEEMAEFYIKEMRNLQPEGPYYIGGSSFGGLAAFEIAQQLHRQGEKIALLALFDTGTPDYPKMLPNTTALRSKLYEIVRRAQHHKNSLKAFNAKERANYIFDKLKKVKLKYRRKIANAYKKAARKFYLKTKGKGSIPNSYIQIEDQIWKAGQKYLPTAYPGKMTLFRASNQPLGIQSDPTLGWENFVSGELEIHEVPGHHGSIVAEPYVRVLAEKLNDCLALGHVDTKQKFLKSEIDEIEKSSFVEAINA